MSRCLMIAELGVNHNGSAVTLVDLVRAAKRAGADAVKIQCRTPELHARADEMRLSCTTTDPREMVSALTHRQRLELDHDALAVLDAECRLLDLPWFASCWDVGAFDRVRPYRPKWWKVASASGTDLDLVRATRREADATGATVIASTGAMEIEDVDRMMAVLGVERTVLLHCVMGYPVENEALNALTMLTLGQRYECAVGYSGHERGVQVSAAMVAMGAAARWFVPTLPWGPVVIERHITLDRTMRGSDHAASLEPGGFAQLVRDVRVIEAAMGDGTKTMTESERREAGRLRR